MGITKFPKNMTDPPQENSKSSEVSSTLWTVDEVADYMRLKPETIRSMVRRGLIPGMKIGRVWRFKREDIESWIRSTYE